MGADEAMITPVADRKGHDRRYSVDIGKIQAELGYQPAVDFETGLAATIRWYSDNEAWWRPLKATR
jgi:dTDP-glucose 4,6-dehydratase